MAKINTDNSINNKVYIPEEILLQILLRLPVKSLLRLKSVCKTWLSLIASSDFVGSHHRHRPKDRILMYGGGAGQNPPPPLKFALLSDHDNICSDLELTLPGFSPDTWFDNFSMLHFDGIICLYYHDTKYTEDPNDDGELIHAMHIYLWNPATRRIRPLPRPQLPFIIPQVSDLPALNFSVGFGFDSETNSYKVVKFIVRDFWPSNVIQSWIAVYSLSTDSWETVSVGLHLEEIISNIKEPLRNGKIYCWSGREFDDEGSHILVWFDFSNHEVGSIPFPDGIRNHPCLELTVITDNVASVHEVGTGSFVVWIMNEFGNKESWTHLYKINPFWERTVSIFDDGQTFSIVWDKRLYVYNSGSMMSTPFTRDLYGGIILKEVRYKETLVSIETGKDAANSLTKAGHKRKRLNL